MDRYHSYYQRLADDNAGSKRAASIAIIAMTTSSSISVNPLVAFAADRVFNSIIIYNNYTIFTERLLQVYQNQTI